MNLAHDIYYSKYITTIELTKIHRQAQKSGIIVASKSINDQIPLFNKKNTGYETIGELQDMHFDISDNTDSTRERVMYYFKQYYENDNNIMNTQILAPVKERGNASVFNLNLDIQEFVNPQSKTKNELKVSSGKDNYFYLREGDKVMCIKNNYKLFNQLGEKTEVFNGWVGILEKIETYIDMVTIFFPIINERVLFSKSDVSSSIILGYASTIHKYQGSSAKYIIGVLDNTTPPNMRTKELLYTLITRAEKDCTVVAQNSALYNAILSSGIKDKNTFLQTMLDENI
jgi:exodeoxyribonuclease V alpha subunit